VFGYLLSLDSSLSSSLLFASSDAVPSSTAMKEGFNGTPPVIVGNDGLASLRNVGLALFSGTAKVGVKGRVTKDVLGALVGLAVGNLFGLVPGAIGGQVFLQIV